MDGGIDIKLIAHQGDTLDRLIYRHCGQTAELVELALDLNPTLANHAILDIGTVVEMPDNADKPQQASKTTVQLWD